MLSLVCCDSTKWHCFLSTEICTPQPPSTLIYTWKVRIYLSIVCVRVALFSSAVVVVPCRAAVNRVVACNSCYPTLSIHAFFFFLCDGWPVAFLPRERGGGVCLASVFVCRAYYCPASPPVHVHMLWKPSTSIMIGGALLARQGLGSAFSTDNSCSLRRATYAFFVGGFLFLGRILQLVFYG